MIDLLAEEAERIKATAECINLIADESERQRITDQAEDIAGSITRLAEELNEQIGYGATLELKAPQEHAEAIAKDPREILEILTAVGNSKS